MDVSALGLSGSAALVLQQLVVAGDRSVAQLAVETGIADSVVSRAVRDLVRRGLVQHGDGRPARVALAPRVGDVVRALAEEVRAAADGRGRALEELAAKLAAVAPPGLLPDRTYWAVPMRADAVLLENEVRTVVSDFAACVPAGRRPRGVPRRARPGNRIRWRVLLDGDWPANMVVPRDTTLEVRRSPHPLPWLEVLDRRFAAVEVPVGGCRRTVWCGDGSQVDLALAGFEWWWEGASQTARDGTRQSTSAAQPLDRATAARQRR